MVTIENGKTVLWSLMMLSVFFIACNKEGKTNKDSKFSNSNIQRADCFKKNFSTYGEMLTMQDILKHIDLDEDIVKMNDSEDMGEYESCYYIWASDRPNIESDVNVLFTFPDNNQIGLKNLSAYKSDYTKEEILDIFEIGYKQLDDKDIKTISKNIEKEYLNKSKAERENAESLIETRKNMEYEKVFDVGNSAYWRFTEDNGGDFVVLSGNETFTINVKISLNPEENFELAKKLALEVLSKCS